MTNKIQPAVPGVVAEVGEVLVHGVDSLDHQINGRSLLSLPGLCGQEEGLQDGDSSLDHLPLSSSEGQGGPQVGLVLIGQGLQSSLQVEDGLQVCVLAVPPGIIGILQLLVFNPKPFARGLQLLVSN